MRDMLREGWAYQEIKQEGLDEGLQKGRQEGRQEGLQKGRQEGQQKGRQEALHEALEEQRLAVVEIVQGRFPSLESLTRNTVDVLVELGALRHLLVKLSLAPTEEAAKQVLLTAGKTRD